MFFRSIQAGADAMAVVIPSLFAPVTNMTQSHKSNNIMWKVRPKKETLEFKAQIKGVSGDYKSTTTIHRYH